MGRLDIAWASDRIAEKEHSPAQPLYLRHGDSNRTKTTKDVCCGSWIREGRAFGHDMTGENE
jgi:hypothetical protein